MIYIGYSDDYEVCLLIQDKILFVYSICRVAKVCAFVYSNSDFLKVTIIFFYIRHVRIKFDKDCVLKVIMECVFSKNM